MEKVRECYHALLYGEGNREVSEIKIEVGRKTTIRESTGSQPKTGQ
jgi:hypothetical protein